MKPRNPPTPPTTSDQDIPSPTNGLARPNTQEIVPDTRDNDTSHPQNVSMTDLTDSANDNAVTGNVAVADDVAVPDIATTPGRITPGPNQTLKSLVNLPEMPLPPYQAAPTMICTGAVKLIEN